MDLLTGATTVLDAGVRLTVPLLFAGIGEWIAQKAGTLNLSIEGMMLGGAFGAVVGFTFLGGGLLALLCGAAVGLLIGLIHGVLSHGLDANTFVVGITLTVVAAAVTAFLAREIGLGSGRLSRVGVPVLESIPLVGRPLFFNAWPAYLLLVLIPLAAFIVYRTRWGLEIRSVGEDPAAADLAGVPVNRRRREALAVCGLLAGLGGAYLAIGEVGSFNQGMTGGRGFVVIAAVVFGGWRLGGLIGACFLFGLADSLRLALPALGIVVNPQLLIMFPFLFALLLLAIVGSGMRMPSALGEPFIRAR